MRRFNLPILVHHTKTDGYTASCLFAPQHNASAKRYREALNRLSQHLRKEFRSFQPDADTLNNLFWVLFNPTTKLKNTQLEFRLGKGHVQGLFTTVNFRIDQHKCLYLPRVPKPLVFCQAEFSLTECMHNRLKIAQHDQPDFSANHYLATGNEFITHIEITLDIQTSKLPFELEKINNFAGISGHQTYNGEHELVELGQNFQEAYPDELPKAWQREKLAAELGQRLFGATPRAIAIVAPPGSGRSTLIKAAYQNYLGQQEHLRRAINLWHLNPNRVIAGQSIVGQWERRWTAILNATLATNKRPASRLWIDNPVALFRIGKSAQSDLTLAQVAKPFLEEQQLGLILEASPAEWDVLTDTDRRFTDLCEVIRLDAPSTQDATIMLLRQLEQIENQYDCRFMPDSLVQLQTLTQLPHHPRALPARLVEACEKLARQSSRSKLVNLFNVEQYLQNEMGVAAQLMDVSPAELQQQLQQRLIGQPEAQEALLNVMHRVRSNLTNAYRPRAVLMFIGPTGVGKTHAAKVLTRTLFKPLEGDPEANLVRFDMNEYVTPADAARLVGDWHNPDGLLTSRVRHQPVCTLLFDEIEKADTSVHDLLLQILGEGRLTDALGRTTDFTRCIIIITSNLGAADAGRVTGFVSQQQDVQQQAATYQQALENFFRPEFLNRIDQIVHFQSLNPDDILHIARLELQQLLRREGFVRRTTFLNVDQAALEQIAKRGFDAQMGGRALKRQLEKELTQLAAEQLVIIPNDCPILLDIQHDGAGLQPRIVAMRPVDCLGQQLQREQALHDLTEQPDANSVEWYLTQALDWREQIYAARDHAEDAETRHHLLTLQEWLYPIQQRLESLSFTFSQNRRFKPKSSSSATHTGGSYLQTSAWRDAINYVGELYQQPDIHQLLSEIYSSATQLSRTADPRWQTLQLQCQWLQHCCAYIQAPSETADVKIESLISHNNPHVLEYLPTYLDDIFSALGYTVERPESMHAEGPIQLTISGFGVTKSLRNEQGVHLFHVDNELTIPLNLSLSERLNQSKLDNNVTDHNTLPIVRSYALPNTVTDLRTGLIHRAALSADDWLMLWHSQTAQIGHIE